MAKIKTWSLTWVGFWSNGTHATFIENCCRMKRQWIIFSEVCVRNGMSGKTPDAPLLSWRRTERFPRRNPHPWLLRTMGGNAWRSDRRDGEILSELKDKSVPVYSLSNWSAETYPIAVGLYPFWNGLTGGKWFPDRWKWSNLMLKSTFIF